MRKEADVKGSQGQPEFDYKGVLVVAGLCFVCAGVLYRHGDILGARCCGSLAVPVTLVLLSLALREQQRRQK